MLGCSAKRSSTFAGGPAVGKQLRTRTESCRTRDEGTTHVRVSAHACRRAQRIPRLFRPEPSRGWDIRPIRSSCSNSDASACVIEARAASWASVTPSPSHTSRKQRASSALAASICARRFDSSFSLRMSSQRRVFTAPIQGFFSTALGSSPQACVRFRWVFPESLHYCHGFAAHLELLGAKRPLETCEGGRRQLELRIGHGPVLASAPEPSTPDFGRRRSAAVSLYRSIVCEARKSAGPARSRKALLRTLS